MTKLFQIWLSDGKPPPPHTQSKMNKLKDLYSDCYYQLFTHKMIVQFLKDNFPAEVLAAYNICRPYSYKADLIRFCLLYIYGGYYFDVSICPNFKLESEHECFALKGEPVEINGKTYENLDGGVMYFKNPKSEFLKIALDTAVYNVLHHRYEKHPLDVTGPMMLYRLDHSMIHLYPCSMVDGRKVVCIEDKEWFQYPNGFSTLDSNQLKAYGANSYAQMWDDKEVFSGVPVHTKVSIIIPTYNYAKYICDAIDSALNQTYKNIEVIVVDDGSTDDTKNTINEKYNDKITYIHQSNQGVSVARNTGIKASTGTWILTIDADDWIDPHYIEHAIEKIENKYSIVTSKAYFMDSTLNPLGGSYPEGDIDLNKTKLHKLVKENYIVTTSLFSKYMWELVGGYDEHLNRAEDWEFWINMVKKGASIIYLENNKQYLKYRVHGNSKSHKLKDLLNDTIQYINKKHNAQRIADISSIYITILGRECDYVGLINYFYSNLSIDDIRKAIYNSVEYKTKKKG